MKEWLSAWKKEGLSLLLTAGITILSVVFPGIVSPLGQVTLTKVQAIKLTGVLIAVFVGISSYAFQLWKCVRKRERIRFAIETNRPVCHCTADGEIMLITSQMGLSTWWYKCPKCKKTMIPMKAP